MTTGLDPITRTEGETWVEKPSTKFANLGSAISSIGATPTIIVLNNTMEVNIPVIVPDNITFRGSGELLQRSGTGAIEFQGFGLLHPSTNIPIFSGFGEGDIAFTGTQYPSGLSTELWDTGNSSLTDRVRRTDAALLGKSAKLIAYPRTMTDSATITEFHSLYFMDGDYPNTCNTFATFGTTYKRPPFLMQDHTRISGAPGARLYESPNDGNGYMIYAYHTRYDGGETAAMCEDIVVEDLYIIGDPLQDEISGGNSCVLLGNCHNGAIRNCTFERVHAYTAVLGLYGTDGNYAYNSEISNCKFIGIGTQVAVLLNAKSCCIKDCLFDQHDSTSLNTYSAIDIEPNTADDVMEDIVIENNTFDMRDIADGSKYCGAIDVQAALDGSIKNLTIRHNKIYGADIIPEPSNFNPLTVGIHIYGVLEGYIYGNSVRGALQRALKFEQSRYLRIFDNVGMQDSDVAGDNVALEVNAVADSDIYYNVFNESPNAARQSTGIIEGEIQHTVTTSGSDVTGIVNLGLFFRFFDLYDGLTVTINNTDYTVLSVAGQYALSTSVSIGTLSQKTFVDANVTTGTENIAITSHGHNTGSRVWLTTTGTVPAGLTASRTYFVIRVDANNLKLADTLDLALAGTPVNITAASGGGTHTLTPVMRTKFSNNTYRDNKTEDGITLEPTGTSVNYGDYTTQLSDYVAPDHSIAFTKLPSGAVNTVLGVITEVPIDPVTWTSIVGVTQSGADNKLTKPGANGWDAGASSVQTIVGNGHLQFTVTETTTNRMCGLSENDTDQDYASIQYAFQVDSTTLGVWESGSNKGTFGTVVANTTILKIERIGTEVKYYKDGSLVYTSLTASSVPLRVDTSLYTSGGTIGGVIIGGVGNVEPLTDPIVDTIKANTEVFIGADTSLVRTGTSQLTVQDGAGNPAKLVASTLSLGGAVVLDILSATATLDFDLTAVDYHDLTITVTGAAANDSVIVAPPNGSTTDVTYSGWVSAADTITVRAVRKTGTTPNPASGTFRATVIKI